MVNVHNSKTPHFTKQIWLRSLGVIRIRISDPRSVQIMCIKGTGEYMTRADSPVPLMYHDPDRWITDLDPDHPITRITQRLRTPKKCTAHGLAMTSFVLPLLWGAKSVSQLRCKVHHPIKLDSRLHYDRVLRTQLVYYIILIIEVVNSKKGLPSQKCTTKM